MFGLKLLLNTVDFGLMLVDGLLGALSGPEPEVVDGVGPWVSTIDLDAVVEAL